MYVRHKADLEPP